MIMDEIATNVILPYIYRTNLLWRLLIFVSIKESMIGINSSGIRKDVADNVGYSIKSNYVLNLIDVLLKSIYLPMNSRLSNLPLTEQIKEISKCVVLIKVK